MSLNKEAIIRTALERWDEEEECFVVESPLFDRVLGAAETPEAAWKLFHELLDDTMESYNAGKLAGYAKPGRPPKGKEKIHTSISPDVKRAINDYADDLHVSAGEVIEYLYAFHEAATKSGLKSKKGREGVKA